MKNLEEEYKKSQQEEMPDLWNKIESGLPEKRQKSKKILPVTRYMRIVAAAVFVAVLIPGVLYLTEGGYRRTDSEKDSVLDMAGQYQTAEDSVQKEDAFDNEAYPDSDMASADEAPEDAAPVILEENNAEELKDCVENLWEEYMEVAGNAKEGTSTVYILRTADGREYRAVLSHMVTAEIETGKEYLFVLKAEEGEGWEYRIEEVK